MTNPLDVARNAATTGTWAQRWVPGVCQHEKVRCIHGDEIIACGFRRRACVVCGRALKGALPTVCSVTSQPHRGVS